MNPLYRPGGHPIYTPSVGPIYGDPAAWEGCGTDEACNHDPWTVTIAGLTECTDICWGVFGQDPVWWDGGLVGTFCVPFISSEVVDGNTICTYRVDTGASFKWANWDGGVESPCRDAGV